MKAMLNIVILAGEYYPYFSACSNCINNIAQELKNGNNVTVIAGKNDFGLKKTYDYDGIEIVRISDNFTCFHKWCEDKIRTNESIVSKLFYYNLLQIKRILFALKNLFRLESIDYWQVRKMIYELKQVEKVKPVDIIIPVSAPYECIFAAINYKIQSPNVKVIPFQLDHFAEANSIYKFKFIKRIRYKRHISLEKLTLENCTHIFILPQLEPHYKSEIFKKYIDKYTVAEHPLFKKHGNNPNIERINNLKNPTKIDLVYAGSFDLKLRNPTYFFKTLEESSIKNKICLNMYTFGNCGAIVGEYHRVLKDTLHDHGRVPMETAFGAMNNADILVSIGNNAKNEVPSKLFDYLSFGKPIIHFYFVDEDAYIEYLRPYPYALCLKMDKSLINQNTKLFSEFCIDNAGKSVCFEDLYKIYYYASPQYISEQFIKYF